MPRRLKPTRREQTRISSGIQKLMREYKRTGKITTSRATYRPRNIAHAQKIAAAIEYGRVRGRRRKGRKRS